MGNSSSPLFGFVQFELAGELALDDGRYLLRNGPAERVVVTETEGALPPARRRRRRPRKAVQSDTPVSVGVTVVTVIIADKPFSSSVEAQAWADQADDSDFTGDLLEAAAADLDRIRGAEAVASGIPFGTPTSLDNFLTARIGYGEGDLVASGRFLEALEVDARGGVGSRRRERANRTGATARTAAILGGREPATACEVLIPRLRMDLEIGNHSAAKLMAAPAIAATISELEFAVESEGHEADLDQLEALLPNLHAISGQTEDMQLSPEQRSQIEQALDLAERVIRRRRILDQ